ncbi:unnamed protein product [Larinioides sclopetarius]|uniref:Uncharacterized protein n=1 Tax=Larinioides sclopetarius TaxID=280406 RepID=A0AAV1ZUY2_9ARAC
MGGEKRTLVDSSVDQGKSKREGTSPHGSQEVNISTGNGPFLFGGDGRGRTNIEQTPAFPFPQTTTERSTLFLVLCYRRGDAKYDDKCGTPQEKAQCVAWMLSPIPKCLKQIPLVYGEH